MMTMPVDGDVHYDNENVTRDIMKGIRHRHESHD